MRKTILATLKSFSPEKRTSESKKLCAWLKEQIFFQQAKAILFFAPLPTEVDLWPLVEETVHDGKIAALPCFDAASRIYKSRRLKNLPVEIVSGRFGIREPAPACVEVPLADFDLVLVPSVAFDSRGNRLGRGGGIFDRLLAEFRGVKCGIAFEEQFVEKIPAETHDVRMDFILTPTRCVKIEK
ncbi:MAG TPA: 5-formyltetrahydrofolate cyclo-ligase [Verrucomicrobiae bacterium]|nr:5-formyltetrahydrofolate cyclo-ligase [Verrucomicrobiae bacterium]